MPTVKYKKAGWSFLGVRAGARRVRSIALSFALSHGPDVTVRLYDAMLESLYSTK